MLTVSVPQHPVQDGADVRVLGHLAATRAGVGQQVVDQSLHPRGPVGGEAMYSSALASSFPWQRSFKQAHEPGHHPQRLPEVVRGHVGELLQVLVGAGQVVGGPLQGLLGPLALGDVAEDLRGPDDPAVLVLDRRDGHGHVEPPAVLG